MAEVSWLSDYMGQNDRSADRFGLGSDQGIPAPGAVAPGMGPQALGSQGLGSQGLGSHGLGSQGLGSHGLGSHGLGSQGIAGLLGIGLEADAQSWQERALCAETDPEAFFPEKGGSTREAKKICTGCEVKAECLEYALTNDERFGIWGGLSERERRRLRRRAV